MNQKQIIENSVYGVFGKPLGVVKQKDDKRLKGTKHDVKVITTKDKKLPVSSVKSSDKRIKDNITY